MWFEATAHTLCFNSFSNWQGSQSLYPKKNLTIPLVLLPSLIYVIISSKLPPINNPFEISLSKYVVSNVVPSIRRAISFILTIPFFNDFINNPTNIGDWKIFILMFATQKAADKLQITNFTFVIIVMVNILIGTTQEIKSKITISKLQLISTPTVTAIRNGEKVEIDVTTEKDGVSTSIVESSTFFSSGRNVAFLMGPG